MSGAPFDKDSVAQNWRERAPAWNKWADEVARMARRFNEPLIEAADAREGHQVLDLASGPPAT